MNKSDEGLKYMGVDVPPMPRWLKKLIRVCAWIFLAVFYAVIALASARMLYDMTQTAIGTILCISVAFAAAAVGYAVRVWRAS